MSSFDRLRKINNHITKFYEIDKLEQLGLGKIISGYDVKPYISILGKLDVDKKSLKYVPSDDNLENLYVVREFSKNIYGEAKIQAGYCVGFNSQLNAMEYHKSSEIIIAGTQMILMLGRYCDIIDDQFSSNDAIALFLPQGTVIELWPMTLHFAPIAIHKSGFKAGILLPKFTNMPLELQGEIKDRTLFKNNKWLLAHPESAQAKNGAFVGITGKNISIIC